jgi:hypothetical protein
VFCLVWSLLGAVANAQESAPCEHPNFVTHECLADTLPTVVDGVDGQDGEDGQDGQDGVDGLDGVDGIDGINGRDGRDGVDGLDGRDGRDGVVSELWYTEMQAYVAASSAAQVYLPNDTEAHRFTMSTARAGSTQAVGVGYAYRSETGIALTLSLTIGLSVGWE